MAEIENTGLLAEVAGYYSDKLSRHGQSPRGVDWNGEEGQVLRFKELCRVIDFTRTFSVTDLGCGYGALYDHLSSQQVVFDYLGVDVSRSMVEAARTRLAGRDNARLIHAGAPDAVNDYGVASGIFNVRLGRTDAEWQAYVEQTLDALDRSSRLGFSFNCLTSYSDTDRMRPDLYYADPLRLFDLCKRRYSRNVALLHDYGLYEFTILVRKAP
ncbi:class I SAM-dependent methyltransferase [Variovorax arabinosiphilus]|uniref:class I SAM-dependent methyltransferase n=1 Tax=Variovorax arabinosiphilus TaxID=3053498 RepID=UPI002574BDEE|nr:MULTISPECIES: class I SAM-dependent methyltransferase [unclassified Variovorax]MDM0122297.1 class I SAM-dependent methyltransferase [Variovorax sp. J2L1-78]MDM0131174.1 class I SAM-dependent methyltransferase [Variovorax sp. J2L1-63]MDM0235060.1 class I SAM-dependent methyltransferase [Variovorax sp. J2R1-6]